MKAQDIGQFLTELRKEKKISQDDLAKVVHHDRTTISKWERGIYPPSLDDITILSNYFNVSINEMMLGKRYSKETEQELNELPITLMKESNHRFKRMIIIFTILSICMLLVFLGYYFIQNYKSIEVYTISSEGENFVVKNGLLIISKEKSYLKIGEIIPIADKNLEGYQFYFKKDNQKVVLTKALDEDKILINNFNEDNYFSYEEKEDLINNLYLEIYYEDMHEILKLECIKDFTNDGIFYKETTTYINPSTQELPSYIQENFTLTDEYTYTYTHKEGKKTITETYKPINHSYSVKETKNKKEEVYVYYQNINTISYRNGEKNSFYSLKTNSFVNDDANAQEKIDYFIQNYLPNLGKN